MSKFQDVIMSLDVKEVTSPVNQQSTNRITMYGISSQLVGWNKFTPLPIQVKYSLYLDLKILSLKQI